MAPRSSTGPAESTITAMWRSRIGALSHWEVHSPRCRQFAGLCLLDPSRLAISRLVSIPHDVVCHLSDGMPVRLGHWRRDTQFDPQDWIVELLARSVVNAAPHVSLEFTLEAIGSHVVNWRRPTLLALGLDLLGLARLPGSCTDLRRRWLVAFVSAFVIAKPATANAAPTNVSQNAGMKEIGSRRRRARQFGIVS